MLEIKVLPSAGKQGFECNKEGKIKCFLKSPAEKGKANKELIKVLGKKLSLPQKNITIIRGTTTRNKVIRIDSNDNENIVLKKLGIKKQLTIY